MNGTAKVGPAPSEAMDERENHETTAPLDYKSASVHRTDAEILDDELSFVRSEN